MTDRTQWIAICKHFAFGLLVPTVFLANALLVPEPYSHPLIHVAISPAKLMPFLENRELMQDITVAILGRMTPNYAPIQVTVLAIFWFLVGLAGSVALSRVLSRSRPN